MYIFIMTKYSVFENIQEKISIKLILYFVSIEEIFFFVCVCVSNIDQVFFFYFFLNSFYWKKKKDKEYFKHIPFCLLLFPVPTQKIR